MQILKRNSLLITLFLFSALYLTHRLGNTSLWDFDEAHYATIARNILESGNWLTLNWTGDPWFLKPPLFFWLSAISFKLFGVSEFGIRLISVIASLGTLLYTYQTTLNLIRNKFWSGTALVILLATGPFIYMSRNGMVDALLTFLITAAIYHGMRATETQKSVHYLIVGTTVGLAFLTKNIVGLFPVVILSCYVTAMAQWKQIAWNKVLLAVVAFLVVALPWHFLMFQEHDHAFLRQYFFDELFKRATSDQQGHSAPFYWYIESLFDTYTPWLFTLVPVGILIVRKFILEKSRAILPFVWFVTIVGIFSLSEDKLAWYILPAFPAGAIAMGYFLHEVFPKGSKPDALNQLLLSWFALALIAGWFTISFKASVLLFTVFNGIFFFVMLAPKRLSWIIRLVKLDWKILTGIAVSVAIILNLAQLPTPSDVNKDLAIVCDGIKEQFDPNQTKLYAIGYYYQATIFYCGQTDVELISADQILEKQRATNKTTLFVIKKSELKEVTIPSDTVYRESGDTILVLFD